MRRWLRRLCRHILVAERGRWTDRFVRCACCGVVSKRPPDQQPWRLLPECGHSQHQDWVSRNWPIDVSIRTRPMPPRGSARK